MSCVIAMAGKGGTGKTTIAGLIIRIIREKKLGSILAIDADPNSNLGELLGVEVKESIGSILDDIGSHPEKVPASMGKDAFIEYRVQSAIEESEGFDLLTMGRPEGPGCYCYVNNALRNVMSKLINDYDFVIIDNEAGLEHLSRRTTRSADSLVVVSDASLAGLKAAKRIIELTRELKIKIKQGFLIINRFNGKAPQERMKDLGVKYLGAVPSDPQIEKISLSSGVLSDLKEKSISLQTLNKLGERIWQCN